MNSTCIRCNRKYTYSRKAGHNRKVCNSCKVNTRRFNLKLKCINYLGGKCLRCGYFKCPASLCFHHINRETKEFEISGSHCYSWTRVKRELDKCNLLCHNCHNEIHYQTSLAQDYHNTHDYVI